MYLANEKNSSIRRCAFCKYWYDPTNSAIRPKGGKDMWEYDGNVKNKCREKMLLQMEYIRALSLNRNCRLGGYIYGKRKNE